MKTRFSGIVIRGEGYGKKLGFPTANLEIKKEDMPQPGVYAGIAILQGKEYKAGIVIGPGDKLEAHLLNYSEDAYGKEMEVRLGKYIREFKKFDSEIHLKNQIRDDLKMV